MNRKVYDMRTDSKQCEWWAYFGAVKRICRLVHGHDGDHEDHDGLKHALWHDDQGHEVSGYRFEAGAES
ncbi:MAG: hypothetical protein HYX72_14470 [Acidobacteria bacterium]|nr:hypothetical protein [Acidobacteriota bacterium]